MPGARQNHKFRWVAKCAAAGKTPPAPTIFQKTPEETTIRKSPLPEANSSKIPYIMTTGSMTAEMLVNPARTLFIILGNSSQTRRNNSREAEMETVGLPGKCAKVSNQDN